MKSPLTSQIAHLLPQSFFLKVSLGLSLVVSLSATASAGERIATASNRFSIELPDGWSRRDNEVNPLSIIGDGFPGKFGFNIFEFTTPAQKAGENALFPATGPNSDVVLSNGNHIIYSDLVLSNGRRLRYEITTGPSEGSVNGVLTIVGRMDTETSTFSFLSTAYSSEVPVATLNTKPFLDALIHIAASIE
jgi:hypothetical protein